MTFFIGLYAGMAMWLVMLSTLPQPWRTRIAVQLLVGAFLHLVMTRYFDTAAMVVMWALAAAVAGVFWLAELKEAKRQAAADAYWESMGIFAGQLARAQRRTLP